MDCYPVQGRPKIFLVASCYGDRNVLRPNGLRGSNADFTFVPLWLIFVSSPLDDLINQLGGPGKVAEMTGRRGRVVKTDKQPQPHYEARESDSSNVDSLNIQEVSKVMRTKSCAVFRLNGRKCVPFLPTRLTAPGSPRMHRRKHIEISACRRSRTLPLSLTFKNWTVVSAQEIQPSAFVCYLFLGLQVYKCSPTFTSYSKSEWDSYVCRKFRCFGSSFHFKVFFAFAIITKSAEFLEAEGLPL